VYNAYCAYIDLFSLRRLRYPGCGQFLLSIRDRVIVDASIEIPNLWYSLCKISLEVEAISFQKLKYSI